MKKNLLILISFCLVAGFFTACDRDKTPQSDLTKLWPAYDTTSKKMGYINAKGEWAIKAVYDVAATFSNGVALVSIDGNKYGYIDKKGNISGSFEDADQHYEGLARVKSGDNFGFVSTSAQWVIHPTHASVSQFSDGFARFWSKETGKFGCINKKNETVIPANFEGLGLFSEGLAPVANSGRKWGFINKKGEVSIACTYDKTYLFSDGLAAYEIGNRYGFLGKDGKSVIPATYKDVDNFFENGLAPVQQDEKWGFIDKKGNMKITPIYSEAAPFCEDVAVVAVGEKYGVINTKGNFIIPASYDGLQEFFHNGLILATTKNASSTTIAYINKKNQVIFSVSINGDIDLLEKNVTLRKKSRAIATEKQLGKPTNHYTLRVTDF